jgi:5-formyltetrahydrofolate cyclo-ligase
MTMTDPTTTRATLRRHLLAERRLWAETPEGEQAQLALQDRLLEVLWQLEPDTLGLYWPMKGEFNPLEAALAAQAEWGCRLALPFARREPVEMHFRAWSGEDPEGVDECGLPSPSGKPIEPDVVLVPCLGFSAEGYRLGYGGGYFDRYLAAHPGVTAIGLAWQNGRIEASVMAPQAHDIALTVVLTETQTWG